MARLSLCLSLALAFSVLPASLAGPACAMKNFQAANCVAKCQQKWGWTGAMMNTDRWGSVIKKIDTEQNWDSVIAKACGVAVSSTVAPIAAPTAVSTDIASTESAISTSAVAAAAAIPSIQSSATPSTLHTSSTTVISSSTSSHISSSSTPSSTKAEPVVTTSSLPVPTQGFVASTRSRLITSTVVRPTTTSTTPQQTHTSTKQPAAVSTAAARPSSAAESNTGSTSNADIQAYLQAHNSIRAQHGAAPLTWSDSAASKAQQWANGCVFKHSGGSLGPFGENLAAGTGSSYGIAAAVKSWTDEVSQYNPSNPVPSHFTQVVWKGTSQVGCAVQTCNGIFDASFGPAKFFVCEYSAQGNIIGQFGQNVQV